jgi:two-component system chemotaxis response regulator CheB
MKQRIKVLVCDDSVFSRVTLRKIIEADAALRLVDCARNGEEAVERAVKIHPDVILMDVNMPVKNGMSALKEIVKLEIAPVIMLSVFAGESAGRAVEAVQAGAFDFVSKPDGSLDFSNYGAELVQKIKRAADSDIYQKTEERTQTVKRLSLKKSDRTKAKAGGLGFKVVALGVSTGGPRSILEVLPQLPGDLNAAVIVVQHMPTAFITAFTDRLNTRTAMECVESKDGMVVEPGKIYIARGGIHLKLRKRADGVVIIHETKEPPHLFMPSIDIMMDSVSEIFGRDTIGVLMTGMGKDGAEGMVKISDLGGVTIAESEETAVVYGMPQEAIRRGGAKIVAPHHAITSEILKAVTARKSETKKNDI